MFLGVGSRFLHLSKQYVTASRRSMSDMAVQKKTRFDWKSFVGMIVGSGIGAALINWWYKERRLQLKQEKLEALKRLNAPEHTKLEERNAAVKKNVADLISNSAKIFDDDLKYTPFLESSSMETALRCEITKETREPGVVIVLSPKDSGKTTRMARVVRTLTEEEKIAGAYRINPKIITPSEESVMDSLSASINAPKAWFFDFLPTTKKPIVFVLDGFDRHYDDPQAISRLKELADELARESVAPGKGIDFQVYMLTSSPDIAQALLTVNGGRKVRLLGYGDEIIGGSERYDQGSWSRKGLKLNKDDIEKLVNKFNETRGLNLDVETRTKLIEVGVTSGTPGFVRDICSMFADKIHAPESRRDYLKKEGEEKAKMQEDEWKRCSAVKRP